MKDCRFSFVILFSACVVWTMVPATAQVQRGTIHGAVRDASGAMLPGVVLQLTSDLAAPRDSATDDRGVYRFRDLDPGEYSLRAALPGFASLVRSHVLVSVGGSTEIAIEMAVAQVAEDVVVEAASPVLDVGRQGNVTNFDQAMLNEVPTARDPWALMQHLPGVTVFRPNVGGSESTNQAQFVARGDNGANTMWNIDGVTITDMAAIGASTTYFDFNAFEEVQFTTGGLDARQQTGGLGINLVSKRGTNTLRGSARTYFTNDDLQGDNISPAQRAAGLSGNRVTQITEFGGDAGGPLRTDRLWFWTGVSRNDVRQLAINGFPDTGAVNTVAAKGDAQFGAATRLSFLFNRGEKVKTGRAAAPDRRPETTWDQSGATHIYKAEGSGVVGRSLFLSGKFAHVDLDFALIPQGGLDSQAYFDFAAQVWHGGFTYSAFDRAQYQTQVDGNWSHGRHDVKFGVHYRRTAAFDRGGWPGDGTHTSINTERLGLPTGVGFANLTRAAALRTATEAVGFYAGDVLTFHRFTLDLGMRVDHQRARNEPSLSPANGLAPATLPALDYPGGPLRVWTELSPRLGLTFRATDRTIVRSSYARFTNQLGSDVAVFESAAQQAVIEYHFQDANGDRLAQLPELIAPTGRMNGVNPANPSAPFSPNLIHPNLTSPSTQVFIGGIEREIMPDFSVGVNVGLSYTTNALWRSFIGLTNDDFVPCRSCIPGTITSDTTVYQLAPGVTLPPGNGRVLANRQGYHQRYWNVDLLATKRLSERWMLRGFVTLQRQREYFDDPSQSIQDPTPRLDQFGLVASGFLDGGIAANLGPVSPSNLIIHSEWNYSLAGVYELRWDVNLSGAMYGRQGYPKGEVFSVNRPGGLGVTPVLLERDLDADRFPATHLLDLRLQKRLSMGPARATLSVDLFNTLNTASTLRQFGEATATTYRNPLEIVAPRLLRLGLQLQF